MNWFVLLVKYYRHLLCISLILLHNRMWPWYDKRAFPSWVSHGYPALIPSWPPELFHRGGLKPKRTIPTWGVRRTIPSWGSLNIIHEHGSWTSFMNIVHRFLIRSHTDSFWFVKWITCQVTILWSMLQKFLLPSVGVFCDLPENPGKPVALLRLGTIDIVLTKDCKGYFTSSRFCDIL